MESIFNDVFFINYFNNVLKFYIIYHNILYYACYTNDLELVKYLVSLNKIDINVKGVLY